MGCQPHRERCHEVGEGVLEHGRSESLQLTSCHLGSTTTRERAMAWHVLWAHHLCTHSPLGLIAGDSRDQRPMTWAPLSPSKERQSATSNRELAIPIRKEPC